MKIKDFIIKVLFLILLVINIQATFAQNECGKPYRFTPDQSCDISKLTAEYSEYWIELDHLEFENILIFATSQETTIISITLYTGSCEELTLVDEISNECDTIYFSVDDLDYENNTYYLLIEFAEEEIDFEIAICETNCTYSISPASHICTIGDELTVTINSNGMNYSYTQYGVALGGGNDNCIISPFTGTTVTLCPTSTQLPSGVVDYIFNLYLSSGSCCVNDYLMCSINVSVLVEPVLQPIFETNYYNTCHVTTTHEITNWDSNLDYTYQIGLNGTPQTFTNYIFNVDWTGVPGGELIITAEHPVYGCPKTNSVTIYECCDSITDTELNDDTLTSGTYDANYTINGTLTINGNVTFENCDIYFGPNAKIIVNPSCTLTIDNSVLMAGCDLMWDGIYLIDETSVLYITGSTVKNAKNAVISEDCSFFDVSGTTFQDNYKNIIIEPCSDTYNSSITACDFLCANQLMSQDPSVNASRTYSGIEINSVFDDNAYFIIGESSSSLENSFTNMDFGIKAIDSKIQVLNNYFSAITYQNGVESAIYLEGHDYDENFASAIIGGYNTYDRNYFENVCYGIYANVDVNFDVFNNEFNYPVFGIFYSLNIGYCDYPTNYFNEVNIKNNDFTYPSFLAIWGANNPWCTSEILSNDITLSTSSSYASGIALQEFMTNNNYSIIEVAGNTITSPRSYGIYGTNLTNPLITNNQITSISPSATSRIGITLTDCDGAEVTGNSIYYSSSSAYDVNGGIYTSLCDNALIECNHILEAGYGIRCDNTMISTLRQNFFDDDKYGLWLCNGGIIGEQGDDNPAHNHYNLWDDCDTWDTYTSGSTDGGDSHFWIREGVTAEDPQNHYAEQNPQSYVIPFDDSGNDDAPLSCPQSQLMMIGGANNFNTALSESIISGSKIFADASSEWLAKNAVYQALMKDTSTSLQLSQNNILQNFKDSVTQAAMGQLESVNKQLAQQKLTFTQLQNLFNFNQSIVTTNDIEENSQTVNAILIDIKLNNKKSLDSLQLLFLQDLAWKCPFIDGRSVYQARAMLSYYDDITVIYFNSCEYELNNDSKRMAAENEAQEKPEVEPTVKVYPNPASTTLFVEISADEVNNAVFNLYNMLGQNVLEQALEDNSESITIDVDKFKAGFYSYSVSINNEVISSERIIFIK